MINKIIDLGNSYGLKYLHHTKTGGMYLKSIFFLEENYQNAFRSYFLKTLTSRLTDYSSSKFEIVEAEQKSSSYTIIKSKIVPENGSPEIKIDWRVYTKNPEKPLIRDLIVEGLSLARTQKEEFSSILNSNNNDIQVLISKLKDFVNN